jgi:hypothetical protein
LSDLKHLDRQCERIICCVEQYAAGSHWV